MKQHSVKISKKARELVRDKLFLYPEMQIQNKRIRESILNGTKTKDDLGTVVSFSRKSSYDDKIIEAVTHEKILFNNDFMNIVENVLSESSDEAQLIIELKYFRKERYSWNKIALTDGVNHTYDSCRKIERAIVDEIVCRLGW